MKDYTKYPLTVVRSPFDKRDWKVSAIYPKDIILPKSVDYRPQMQPVRDQGTQGSCLAQSGSAMKEWQEHFDIGLNEYLSPQCVYNLRKDTNEEGMYGRDLMEILKEKGISTEVLFPYESKGLPGMDVLMNAAIHKIANYAQINTLQELKTSLFLNGPCIICVPVYNYGNRLWKQRPGDSFLGGHGTCLDGYDDTIGGFYYRNSWGADWEDHGYTVFPYEDFPLAWEFWASVDAKSYDPPIPPIPPKPEKKGCLRKFFNF